MTALSGASIRVATVEDSPQLLRLWGSLFSEDDAAAHEPWRRHAREWLAVVVGESATAHLPVVDIAGQIVATAVGTLELGVPNPLCPRGRTVRLANVITVSAHRGRGFGTRLVADVVEWAASINADRVDLSATPEGQGIYERAGFVLTTARRMKLVLRHV